MTRCDDHKGIALLTVVSSNDAPWVAQFQGTYVETAPKGPAITRRQNAINSTGNDTGWMKCTICQGCEHPEKYSVRLNQFPTGRFEVFESSSNKKYITVTEVSALNPT